MEDKNTLEVGDVVYQIHYGTINKLIIDRVTPQRAYSRSHEFKRQYSSLSVDTVGRDSWSSVRYTIETEELKTKYQRQGRLGFIASFKFDSLSDDTLKQVVEILKQSNS